MSQQAEILFKQGQLPEGHSLYESLRLWMFCKSRKWTHLPCPGGIYDQHPDLIDQWSVIDGAWSEYEESRRAAQALEARNSSKQGRP